MNSWRDKILNEFVPNVNHLTIVSDTDALLAEMKLALILKDRGFDIIEFNDAIEFRYAYESNYRSIWDNGEHTDLVVVLRLQDTEIENLPFDLLKTGRRLSFDLGSLFPNLSYPVVEKLDRNLLDLLYNAQQNYSPGRIGDNATKDFILSHVFGIAAELIINDVELLRTLLRIHYNSLNIPKILTNRFIEVLKGNKIFVNWSIDKIILDEKAFFSFLQERWSIFVSSLNTTNQVGEDSSGYDFQYMGPSHLPFEHQDIRVYIDNLFVEGKLSPIKLDKLKPDFITLPDNTRITSGIIASDNNSNLRISKLFDLIKSGIPTDEFRHSDWILFALKWAKLSHSIYSNSTKTEKEKFQHLWNSINTTFTKWLNSNYAGLINLPPNNPVMLHHVSRMMSRELENPHSTGVALIVLDGLALDQWGILKQAIQEQVDNITMHESALFAWIPTLTSISRQSIFAGKAPLYFPNSINTTNNESKLWRQFWESNGLSRLDIAYQRGLGDGNPITDIESIFNPGKTKAIGLVVDKVDKIMHGMQLGSEGMLNQIQQWARYGYLSKLIKYLMDYNYQIWLTSDHGNIECVGKGRPSEGSIAETRGERVRIYPTTELCQKVLHEYDFAKAWSPVGLPKDYVPLVAKGKDAFIRKNEHTIGHGGISIEEVIVPFIKIEKRVR